jgi:hypothetical protein
MAQIDLGSIKFNWKGSYSGATAYVVDDVVESSGSSYICIAATTGNAPPNATYWEQMSSAGTNGTDGTDLGTTLTTQGDIVYRDASGLARLGAGTSGQVLQTNGTGANPSWGTVSSDFVKLASNSVTAGSSSGFNFEGFVDNSTYSSYYLKARNLVTSANNTTVRLLTGTNTEFTSSVYKMIGDGRFAGSTSGYDNFSDATATRFRFSAGFHANSTDNNQGAMLDLWLTLDAGRTAEFNSQWITPFYNNNDRYAIFNGGGSCASNQTWTGLKFFADGGTITNCKVELYGIK